jgi:hypothetical protein
MFSDAASYSLVFHVTFFFSVISTNVIWWLQIDLCRKMYWFSSDLVVFTCNSTSFNQLVSHEMLICWWVLSACILIVGIAELSLSPQISTISVQSPVPQASTVRWQSGGGRWYLWSLGAQIGRFLGEKAVMASPPCFPQLTGAFYVGKGWVAGGCWDDYY